MNDSDKKQAAVLIRILSEFLRFWQNGERRSAALLWILLVVYVSALSVFLYQSDNLKHLVPVWVFFVSTLTTLPLGMVFWGYLKNHYAPQKASENLFALPMFFCSRQIPTASEICYSAMFVVSTIFVLIFFFWGPFDEHFPKLNSLGTLFALITGLGTMIGTLIAIQQILELKHTVVSFTQLQERLINLLDQAHYSDDSVVFLAYTILPGAFNVRPELTKRLRTSIMSCAGRIRVVCLDETPHTDWLSEHFDGKRDTSGVKIDSKYLADFNKQCSGVLDNLKQPISNQVVFGRQWIEMPGFYFFASSQRAILVAPLKMPRMDVPDENGAGASLHVEPLGFETTDRKIIGMLQNEFNRYARPDFASAAKIRSSASQATNAE